VNFHIPIKGRTGCDVRETSLSLCHLVDYFLFIKINVAFIFIL
jgi:hypothetical protein